MRHPGCGRNSSRLQLVVPEIEVQAVPSGGFLTPDLGGCKPHAIDMLKGVVVAVIAVGTAWQVQTSEALRRVEKERRRADSQRDKALRAEVSEKQQSVNEIFKLFTAPDLLYIIKVILSLCAMLFAFDMISGEKETGTLRQSLSGSLARPILILGKWVGGFASFILPFFIAVLLGTILVTLSPKVDMDAQDWAKMGLFLLSSTIYLAVFFSLGLLVSCLTHQSSSSLVISLFVWTTLVFVIPNLGNVLARQLVELPTVQQLELRRTYNRRKAYFERDRADGLERRRIYERARAEADQVSEEYRNRFNRLATISQNITRISPAAAFTFLATDTMGTGMAEERRLKRAVLQYRQYRKDEHTVFNYRRSSCREALGPGGLGNLLILVLLGILSCTGAYVAFMRYDVR